MAGFNPPSFVDACSYLVRYLVQSAYSMAEGSVRPAKQGYPTGNDVAEFATVRIAAGPTGGFGALEWSDDSTHGSTKVSESIETLYTFTASIQFFRHGSADAAGLPAFGLGAVDKAARLDAVLGSSAMMALMERMGLGLESGSQPIDVTALVSGDKWEDRGAVTMTFNIVNREQFLVESYAAAAATVKVQQPGASQLITETIEVTA